MRQIWPQMANDGWLPVPQSNLDAASVRQLRLIESEGPFLCASYTSSVLLHYDLGPDHGRDRLRRCCQSQEKS